MAALKRAQRVRLSHRVESPFSGCLACVAIMIAAYQHHFNVAVARSEGSEIVIESCCVTGFGVYQITEDDKASCFVRI